MPLYTYKCPHGHKFTIFNSISQYMSTSTCPDCPPELKVVAERFIDAAPAVVGDYPGYRCPITDTWIEGRKAHEENLAKHGCRVLEPGETERCIANRKAREEAFDESVAATAEDIVSKMDAPTLEALACGLDHGLDASVVRSTKTN